MPLSPGTPISHDEILSTLGRGGMGEGYAALDTNLSRRVALKILSPQFIKSALNHPNIVTVYEVGECELPADSGRDPKERHLRYIAMELVEGETLRALVAKRAMSLRERVDILAPPSHIFDIPVNAWMGGNNHGARTD